jgi:hypothetical protein
LSKRPLYSVSQLAPEFGVDRRTLAHRLRDIASDGLVAGHPAYYLATVIKAVFGGQTSTKEEILKEQLLALQAERLAREGRTLDADDTANHWIRLYASVKTPLLAVPTKLAPQLARLTTPHECEALLRKELHNVLRRIAGVEPVPGMVHRDEEITK